MLSGINIGSVEDIHELSCPRFGSSRPFEHELRYREIHKGLRGDRQAQYALEIGRPRVTSRPRLRVVRSDQRELPEAIVERAQTRC